MLRNRILASLLAAGIAVSLSACGSNAAQTGVAGSASTSAEQESSAQNASTSLTTSSVSSPDELEASVTADVENTVSDLTAQFETLKTSVPDYTSYQQHIEDVEGFYENVLATTNALCIRLEDYALAYAGQLQSSGESFDDKYDDLEDMYDVIYDDARDDIYDGIYEDLLGDTYDYFYDGILDDAYNTVPYEDWYDAKSDNYELWYDTKSDIYEAWYDAGSDIYSFWFDMRSCYFDNDAEKAAEKIAEFKEDVEKMREKTEQ